MVLTLKGTSKALAYALTHDFNFRDPESHTRFHVGQGVSGTVVALPSGKTGDCTPQEDLSPGLISCSGIISATPMLTHHLRIQQQAQGHWHKQRSYVSCMPPCHAVLSPFSASHAVNHNRHMLATVVPPTRKLVLIWPSGLDPCTWPFNACQSTSNRKVLLTAKAGLTCLSSSCFPSVWHAALILRKPPTGCCYIWMVEGGSLLGHSAYHNRSRLVHAQTVIHCLMCRGPAAGPGHADAQGQRRIQQACRGPQGWHPRDWARHRHGAHLHGSGAGCTQG